MDAVKDNETSNKLFTKILEKKIIKVLKVVESEGVITSFFKIGENKIEPSCLH